MLYFIKGFMKKIYITPWVFLIALIILIGLSVFDIILWIQGYLDTSITFIVFGLFVTTLLIAHMIYKQSEVFNEYLIVVSTSIVFFMIIFFSFVYFNPTTIDFYEGEGHTLILKTTTKRGYKSYVFYEKEGIFGSKIAGCYTNNKAWCSYTITDNKLVVETYKNNELTKIHKINLE